MGRPTLHYSDDFEHGLVGTYSANTGVWDSLAGTPAIVTDVVRTGARALEISAAGAAEYVGFGSTHTVVTQAVYLYLRSLPTGLSFLVSFVNPNGNAQLAYNPGTGKLEIRGANFSNTPGGPTIAAQTWYRVVVEYDTSGSVATMRASVDGQGWSAQATQASASTTDARLGTGAAQTFTCVYDDWIGSTTPGDYDLIVLAGSHRVVTLQPNADGTHNVSAANQFEYSGTGTDITNASTDVYTLVNEAPMELTLVDYVNQVGAGATNYVEVQFADLPSGNDAVARILGRTTTRDAAASGTALGVIRFVLGGTTVQDLRTAAHDPGTTTWLLIAWLDHPTGGRDGWSRADVNALRCRMGYGDGNPDWYTLSLNVSAALIPDVVGAGTLGLTLEAIAPTISEAQPGQTVECPTLALTLSPVAPAVTQRVTPGTLTLTLSPVAPAVTQHVTPGTLALTLDALAPTVTGAGAPQTIEPGVLTLTLSPVAPALRQAVVPGSLTLTLSPVAPDIVQAQFVSPAALGLTLVALSPVVGANTITPPTLALTASPVAPAVAQSVQPPALALALVLPGPAIAESVAPGALTLVLALPAPTITTGAAAVAPPLLAISVTMGVPAVTTGPGLGVPAVARTAERRRAKVAAAHAARAVGITRERGGMTDG